MNRIRKVENGYQVLITPNLINAPDNPLLFGNWDDVTLRNYHVLFYNNLNDALAESYHYPDMDWYRIVDDHKYVYSRLKITLNRILRQSGIVLDIYPHLMSPDELKNRMFDRVLSNDQFNLLENFSDIINFTITSPYTYDIRRIANVIERYRDNTRDDLRIRHKKVFGNTVICLIGLTELGTTYSIKLMPTIFHNWNRWRALYHRDIDAVNMFNVLSKQQEELDKRHIFN